MFLAKAFISIRGGAQARKSHCWSAKYHVHVTSSIQRRKFEPGAINAVIQSACVEADCNICK